MLFLCYLVPLTTAINLQTNVPGGGICKSPNGRLWTIILEAKLVTRKLHRSKVKLKDFKRYIIQVIVKSNSQQSNLDSSVKIITSFWLFGICLFYVTCHLPHFCLHSLSLHSIKITNNSTTIQLIKINTTLGVYISGLLISVLGILHTLAMQISWFSFNDVYWREQCWGFTGLILRGLSYFYVLKFFYF